MAKLTAKQQRFIEEYLIDLNATQAAIRAGYSEKNADKIGSQLLGKTRVKEQIDKALEKRSNKLNLDAEWVLTRLMDISNAAYQANDYSPANKATELIGKHLGLFTDKLEVKGHMTFEQLLDDIDE
jgi:phage terminase small subunit